MARTDTRTVYAIQCRENGRVYIGCTNNVGIRIKAHFAKLRKGVVTRYSTRTGRQEKTTFQIDFDHYGQDAFTVHILEENIDYRVRKEREAHWIKEYNATNPVYGYNARPETDEVFDLSRELPVNRWKNSR